MSRNKTHSFNDRRDRPQRDSRDSRDSGRDAGRHNDRRDQPRCVLSLPAAEELLALVDDAEGDADEDLLSDALEALRAPRVVDNATHARRKRGEVVAIGFTPQERSALAALIVDEQDLPADVARRSQERLTQAVADARAKFA